MRGALALQDAAVSAEVLQQAASLHDHRLAFGVRGDSAQAVFTPILENQRDALRQIFASFFFGSALAIGAWNFG